MQLNTEDIDQVRIVRLRVSAVDASNTAELMARLPDALKGARRAILDLGQVSSIDGDGFVALCVCWGDARRSRVRLALCGLPPRPRLAARLLKLDTLLSVFADLNEAMAAHGVRELVKVPAGLAVR